MRTRKAKRLAKASVRLSEMAPSHDSLRSSCLGLHSGILKPIARKACFHFQERASHWFLHDMSDDFALLTVISPSLFSLRQHDARTYSLASKDAVEQTDIISE